MATGKTTLARALGQAMHWPVIETDRVRKTLVGMEPTARATVGFGEGIYAADFSTRTYAEMRRQVAAHLAAGESVILDGSYKRAGERELVRQLAREHGAETILVYCECPPAEARRRLGLRLADPQAFSDGRLELFEAQKSDFDPLGPEERPLLRLDTNREIEVVLAELKGFVLSYLEGDVPREEIKKMPNASEKFNQMTDGEIESWVSKNMLGQGANLAISILMRRSVNDTTTSVKELKEAIKEFTYSSEKYAKKIVWLTWALVLLTIALLVLTAVMAFKM